MTKIVKSAFHGVIDTAVLYEHDVEKLVAVKDECLSSDGKDARELGALLTRVIDWISAESLAASHSIRISAIRFDEDDVSAYSSDMLTEGKGDNVLGALQDCVNQMIQTYYDLTQSGTDGDDTIGYKATVLDWVENFPHE